MFFGFNSYMLLLRTNISQRIEANIGNTQGLQKKQKKTCKFQANKIWNDSIRFEAKKMANTALHTLMKYSVYKWNLESYV
jgi:hypothetical protein